MHVALSYKIRRINNEPEVCGGNGWSKWQKRPEELFYATAGEREKYTAACSLCRGTGFPTEPCWKFSATRYGVAASDSGTMHGGKGGRER